MKVLQLDIVLAIFEGPKLVPRTEALKQTTFLEQHDLTSIASCCTRKNKTSTRQAYDLQPKSKSSTKTLHFHGNSIQYPLHMETCRYQRKC